MGKDKENIFTNRFFAGILWLALWTKSLKIMLKSQSEEMKTYVCLKMLINIIMSVEVTKLLGYKTSLLRSTNLKIKNEDSNNWLQEFNTRYEIKCHFCFMRVRLLNKYVWVCLQLKYCCDGVKRFELMESDSYFHFLCLIDFSWNTLVSNVKLIWKIFATYNQFSSYISYKMTLFTQNSKA